MKETIGLRPDWTLQGAIKQQVDKEDMVLWALSDTAPHKIIPPMPHKVWKATPLHALLSKILP